MPYIGISQSNGLMPSSLLKKKYEVTNYDEPEDYVNNYFRNALKDNSCDKPFFESDVKRSDNHSSEMLDLRYEGARSSALPYMPDMFLENVGRDPRGASNDPVFKNNVEQSKQRSKYIKMVDDGDRSITSGEKTPAFIATQIKNNQHELKKRFRIYSESRDQKTGSVGFVKGDITKVNLQENQISISDPLLIEDINKTTLLSSLSNSLQIGWDRVTDHEFKIAQYSMIRSNNTRSNPESNRNEIQNTANIYTSEVASNTRNTLAQLMKTANVQQGINTVQGQKSYPQFNSSRNTAKITKSDNERRNTTGDMIINVLVDVNQTRERSKITRDTQNRNTAVEENDIVALMDITNRKKNVAERVRMSDAILDIVVSESDNNVAGIKSTKLTKNTQNKNSIDSALWLDSKSITNVYSFAKPDNPIRKVQNQDMDFKSSKDQLNSKKQKAPEMTNIIIKKAHDTQKHDEFGTNNRFISRVGSKYTFNNLDKHLDKLDVNDL
jgi:hypothetical protein